MRASAMVLALLLAAGSVAAQEPARPAPAPDYSRDSLLRLLTKDTNARPAVERRVQYHLGYVEFKALGTRWRFIYMPIMMPLSGSRFTVSHDWPDAFELTNTPIATTPRSFRTRRETNKELRRIEELERARIKVNTKQ